MAASLAAFYRQTPVGHIEAGLRTNNIYSPFPEELNRQFTSLVTKFHFAPTKKARQNLINQQVPDKQIFVTGNTVIDSLFSIIDRARAINFPTKLLDELPFLKKENNDTTKIILVTGHRRESFGRGFEEICFAIKELSKLHDEIEIIYPVHLNPNVIEPVNRILSNIKNVHLIEPLGYLPFVKLMDLSYIVITDSGGIQEEAPSLGKPVLVMRNSSERPEAIEAGTVMLVGANRKKIVFEASKLISDEKIYKNMSKILNPYGDGKASQRILKILLEENL
jgi:UDP-N-acetylglucosamine 2-epimerase (non-hydrolysing)